MFNSIWLVTTLYAYKTLPFYIKSYQKRLQTYTNIDIATFANGNMDYFCDNIERLRDRIDKFTLLKNTTETALSLLSDDKKAIIKKFYFEHKSAVEVVKELGIPYNTYRYRKRVALKKLAVNFYILGMTNDRFLQYFDDEYLFINICEALISKNLAHLSEDDAAGSKEALC